MRTTGNALWVSPLTFLQASAPGTGGFFDTANERLGIQHVQPITGPQDLAKVIIEKDTGATKLTIGDVANVVEDHQPLIGDAVVNGREGFMMVVEKTPGANTGDVTRGVQAALDDLRPALSGLKIDSSIYRPQTFIDRAVHNLTRSAWIGALLAILVVGAFFFDWRSALTSLLAMGLSFVIAGLALHAAKVTINAIVFAGFVMALAAVVDDAIANADHVRRRLRERRLDQPEGVAPSPVAIVAEASLQTGRMLVYGTIIFALALLPLFFLHGLPGGSFFSPLAVACLVTVVASLVVALVVTPALSLLLVRKSQVEHREAPLVRLVQRGYERALAPIVRRPLTALLGVVVLTVLGTVMVPMFEHRLLPAFKETELLVHWNGAPGTSLTEMDRITARATEELRALPGVRDVGAHIGRAVLGDQAVGTDAAEMWVSLDPSADHDATVAAVTRVLDGYPGVTHQVETYSQDRINEVLAGPGSQVTVRVYGQDYEVLQTKAEQIRKILAGTKGVVSEHVTAQPQEPTMQIQVDLAAAARHGISPGDVRRAAATLLSGLQVGSLFQDQKVFDVQVWSTPATRSSLTSVRDLPIDTPSGTPVRLGDVADVRVAAAQPIIEHEDVSRYLDVAATVKGGDIASVTSAVRAGLKQMSFPLEYHAEVLGDYTSQQNALHRLYGFCVAAAIGIFLLLQAAFSSWRLAIVAFVALPLALVGGVVAAFIDGDTLTLASVAGLLAVLAVAVRIGMTFMSRCEDLRDPSAPIDEVLVIHAARERVTPILMTVLTTAVILVPVLVFGDIAGQEIVHPMAVVIIGGLLTTALVYLFVVPGLYLRFGPRPVAATTSKPASPASSWPPPSAPAPFNGQTPPVPAALQKE